MFYHVIVETKAIGKGKSEEYSIFDLTDENQVIEQYVVPYISGEDFDVDGYSVNKKDLKRFFVSTSDLTAHQLLDSFNSENANSGVLFFASRSGMVQDDNFAKDVTLSLKEKAKTKRLHKDTISKTIPDLSNDVFIVHGKNDAIKNEIARFIEKVGLPAVILHEQPSSSATIIEKFEKFTNVGYAVVLYTSDDVGSLKGDPEIKSRARQNVLFEHGYFVSKLGRERVCAVVEEDIEIPSDLSGVLFVPYDKAGLWKYTVAKEMKAVGMNVDMNKI